MKDKTKKSTLKNGKRKNKKNKKAKKKRKGKGKGKGKGRKKKRKNRKKKKNDFKDSRQGCQNVTCLNTLLQVLKINKDTVTNFLKQKKRLLTRVRLLENKGKKSNKTSTSATALGESLGGSTSLKSYSPICGGRYNSTTATKVTKSNRKYHF